MVLNPYAACAIAGACGGLARALIGYLSVSNVEKFSFRKFLKTILLQCLIGAVAGFLTQDIKTAIISGLAGEEAIRGIIKRGKAK